MLLQWLAPALPAECAACGECLGPVDYADLPLCGPCQRDLRPIDPADSCSVCSEPGMIPGAGRCPLCRDLPPGFTAAAAAFQYGGSGGAIARRTKYQRQEMLAEILADLAWPGLRPFVEERARPHVVIPSPMWVWRELLRGFNQAEGLARRIARHAGVPMLADTLRRSRKTPPQARRHSRTERIANLEGAFAVSGPEAIAGKRILFVDDVTTTGSTAAHAGLALLAAGAEAVYVATALKASGRLEAR